jgi:Fe-S-cluster-containing hydrogenase component 2
MKCVKACPKEGAITVDNFLATINYDICIGCGLCSRACPRQLITVDGKVLPPKPKKEEPKKEAAPAAAPAEAPKAAEAAPAAPAAEAPKAE